MSDTLPKGWEVASFDDISKYVQRGKSPKYTEKSALPVINQKCIRWHGIEEQHLKYVHPDQWDKWTEERYLKSGDILWNSTGTGTIGRAAIFEQLVSSKEAVVDSHVTIIRSHDEINSKLLHYYIMSPTIQNQIEDMQTGTTNQVELGKGQILNTQITIPPANEQKRIVEKMDVLMAHSGKAKEALDAIPALLDQYRQSILAAAFRGDLTKDWREKNQDIETASELLERVRTERRRRWEEDELAKMHIKGKPPKNDKWKTRYKEPASHEEEKLFDIPATWEWISVGDIAWQVKDGPHYSPKYSDSGIPFISGGNIRPHGVDFENTKYISETLHNELCERCKPEIGDILYTKGGTTGIARVNTYSHEFNVWVHVAVLKLVNSVKPFYIQHALNSPFCYQQAQNYTHGVGNQDLGLTRMVKIALPLAPLEEQIEIIRQIDNAMEFIRRIETAYIDASTKIPDVNQSILAKAFRGELVPQDPNDEPASVLLERIRTERAAQAVKKSKPKRNCKSKNPFEELEKAGYHRRLDIEENTIFIPNQFFDFLNQDWQACENDQLPEFARRFIIFGKKSTISKRYGLIDTNNNLRTPFASSNTEILETIYNLPKASLQPFVNFITNGRIYEEALEQLLTDAAQASNMPIDIKGTKLSEGEQDGGADFEIRTPISTSYADAKGSTKESYPIFDRYHKSHGINKFIAKIKAAKKRMAIWNIERLEEDMDKPIAYFVSGKRLQKNGIGEWHNFEQEYAQHTRNDQKRFSILFGVDILASEE